MAKEVSTHGSKKIATLMKEFNALYPYLNLGIFPPEAKELVAQGKGIKRIDVNKTLSEVRTKTGSGEISFSARKLVGTIEKEFEDIFGLYVQVCYISKEGKGYYTSGEDDKKTLNQLNKAKEEKGCKQWK